MEVLEKLFGGAGKVKLMKLFLFNPEGVFDKKEIQKRTKVTSQTAVKELNVLEKIKFIKKKVFFKEGKKLKSGKRGKKQKLQGYCLDKEFPYLLPLQKMLVETSPIGYKEIIRKFNKAGTIKLITIAGVFLRDDESRIDLLVVGDNLNTSKLKNTISSIESELGCQLRYSIFETEDYKYRIGMCDRLIRDIFDFPHEVLVDRISL